MKDFTARCDTSESNKKQIHWSLSQQGIEQSFFRVIFRIGFDIITTMTLQNHISRFKLCPIESFASWVCYFKEPLKTKNWWMSQQRTENSFLRVIFLIGFDIITTMILKNNISRFNLCPIKGFYSWVCYSESHEKQKHWWMSQQGTENSICRGIFQISSDIITTMILQTNIFKFNLCPIESLYGRVCYFGEPWKKEILINIAAGNRKQHFQNYLLNWLRHYQYNYSSK